MLCRICSGPAEVVARYDLAVIQPEWRERVADAEVTLCRCRRHGTIFTEKPPSPEILATQYVSFDLPTRLANPNLSGARKADVLVKRVSKFLQAGSSIIDIGGGDGAFAKAAAAAGFRSWMQDVHPPPADVLVSAGVTPVAELSPELHGQFDAVTLWDVYEHVWPQQEFLATLRPLLRPGGLLFIEIPSPTRAVAAFLFLSRLTRRPRREQLLSQICSYSHLQLMTPSELLSDLNRQGFTVTHCESHSFLSYRGYQYAQRFIPWKPLAELVGSVFDRHAVRMVLMGPNKTFAVVKAT